eukprot:TRINITY_DN4855_c0_g1_i2.p1 TRINITY_DN4855_c0_g1~~TRINITY_DN4855_c0_g1_i2.p1  ORF type:complete len:125 (+),score=14.39 TRINITY_DN4855_c0_g1_i2:65-439(+)
MYLSRVRSLSTRFPNSYSTRTIIPSDRKNQPPLPVGYVVREHTNVGTDPVILDRRNRNDHPLRPASVYINAVPPIEVTESITSCDGGDPALGHPKIFLNMAGSSVEDPIICGYCGLRYFKKHRH